jgi:hypothetical protein
VPLAAGYSLHWDEYSFGGELMTPAVGPGGVQPMSLLTVASMADMGYAVNRGAADPYVMPVH